VGGADGGGGVTIIGVTIIAVIPAKAGFSTAELVIHFAF
jgi:hypothetical protein